MVAPIPRDQRVEEVFASAAQLDGAAPGLTDLLGAVLANRPAWHRDALCQEYPDVDFFPEKGDDVRPAKQVCAPVPGSGGVQSMGRRAGRSPSRDLGRHHRPPAPPDAGDAGPAAHARRVGDHRGRRAGRPSYSSLMLAGFQGSGAAS